MSTPKAYITCIHHDAETGDNFTDISFVYDKSEGIGVQPDNLKVLSGCLVHRKYGIEMCDKHNAILSWIYKHLKSDSCYISADKNTYDGMPFRFVKKFGGLPLLFGDNGKKYVVIICYMSNYNLLTFKKCTVDSMNIVQFV